MNDVYTALLQLQTLDREITQAEISLQTFEPQINEVEAPLKALQLEVENSRRKLADMRQQSHKLENAANNKRDRLKTYESRLERVRNAREEAAVRTEMDLVRRATEADEQEALEVMDQTKRTDLKLDEMEKQLAKLRSEVEPKKQELINARTEAENSLTQLRQRRAAHAASIDPAAARLYDRVRAGKGRAALAPLGPDGACGNCFNIIPIQEQSEIRRANALRRCEACGVILYPQD